MNKHIGSDARDMIKAWEKKDPEIRKTIEAAKSRKEKKLLKKLGDQMKAKKDEILRRQGLDGCKSGRFSGRNKVPQTAPKHETFGKHYFTSGKATTLKGYTEDSEAKKTEVNYQLIRKLVKGKPAVLDIGCGRGFLVKKLFKAGYKAWGIDVSDWAIKNSVAPGCCSKTKIKDISVILKNQKSELVTAFYVFEHLSLIDVSKLLIVLHDAHVQEVIISVPLVTVDGCMAYDLSAQVDKTHKTILRHDEWVHIFNFHGYKLTNEVSCNFRSGGYRSTFLFTLNSGWQVDDSTYENYKVIGKRITRSEVGL